MVGGAGGVSDGLLDRLTRIVGLRIPLFAVNTLDTIAVFECVPIHIYSYSTSL
jgi:hypothetical protein